MKENDEKIVKMAMIVGATKALEFMESKRRATKEDAIQYISDNMAEFLQEIDNPL